MARASTLRLPVTLDLRQLTREIVLSSIKDVQAAVVLIGGPGCTGKSAFAQELKVFLTANGSIPAAVLDLDYYLRPRSERESGESIVSGYNPSGYELGQAVADIEGLLAGHVVRVASYDKRTSTKGPSELVHPEQVLIIEGVMAFADRIRTLRTIGIFIDAPVDILYENRRAREMQLGFDADRIETKFRVLNEDYHKFVKPQADFANVLVELGRDYTFERVTIRRAV